MVPQEPKKHPSRELASKSISKEIRFAGESGENLIRTERTRVRNDHEFAHSSDLNCWMGDAITSKDSAIARLTSICP